jgi:two-component system sensor histidine kinase PilS (NtrC family)
MSAIAATSDSAPTDLARRVAGLLNLYRLLVPTVLVGAVLLGGRSRDTATHPALFLATCASYFGAAVGLVLLQRLSRTAPLLSPLASGVLDATAIALILYASGGVSSGFGILLVLPVLALTLLAGRREALLIAALATLAVLVPQFLIGLHAPHEADYTTAGVLGAVLFAIALSAWPLAHRIRESEATVRRQEVDLANLAQLSQYIVRHLRESILVVDLEDRIRLINDSAAQMLGAQHARPDAALAEVSPRLMQLLRRWRESTGATGIFATEDPTFVGTDGAQVIRAHFAALGAASPAPVLVFLEDTSLIAEKVQQSKLAALGRLSASIAHEIRNPVGAMSHAGQLLGESPHIGPEDRRLTEIIRHHAERVSRTIDSVLRLSRREAARAEQLPLTGWGESFLEEFCETMQWPRSRLHLKTPVEDIEIRFDPGQLRQIVWNLCENALKHAAGEDPAQAVELRCGRLSPSGRPYLDVADRGPGVPREHVERIFEPFFSAGRGTGLGLFLARELAQANGATLLYEPRHGGGSVFRLVFADPQRWIRETER